MWPEKSLQNLLARFVQNKDGNFAIMTCLLLPLLLGVAGFAVDLSGMMRTRAEMRSASDAAALAASSAMATNGISETDAKAVALRYLKGYSNTDINFADNATIAVTTTSVGSNKTFKVNISNKYTYPMNGMTAIFFGKTAQIASNSTSTSTNEVTQVTNPASIYMVLDKSGSMGYPTNEVIGTYTVRTRYSCETGTCTAWPGDPKYRIKIDAMKLAVADMASTLNTIDPDKKYLRTGADAFDSNASAETPMAWGTAGVVSYVNALSAGGGTHPVVAMERAYDALAAASENSAHLGKNGGVPTKTIIYMTDGVNSYSNSNADTLVSCDAAKRDGMEVYSIGFMVPDSAKAFLLSCATDANHFFDAADAADLYAAFKKIGASTASKLANRISE